MGDTRDVMEKTQVFRIAKEFAARVVVFDELRAGDWELIELPESHWQQGFALPRMVRTAGAVVQTCCLKTHRYGGHFTLSLKNSVGFAAKRIPGDPHDFMRELHASPHQRRMIAEINAAYRPSLVVLDGVEAFVTGGPDHGKRVDAEVVLAGTDRIAIDAVGVALLRHFGTTPEVSRGKIFEQEQIARAVELGLGVRAAERDRARHRRSRKRRTTRSGSARSWMARRTHSVSASPPASPTAAATPLRTTPSRARSRSRAAPVPRTRR